MSRMVRRDEGRFRVSSSRCVLVACGTLVAVLATRVTHATTITTVAGNGTFGVSGDGGAATAAELQQPGLVAVDGAGNLFIDDLLRRIRRVDATTGIITTVAGNGGLGYSGDGGPATAATIRVDAFTVDAAGNLFLGDLIGYSSSQDYGARIRRVDATTGTITTYVGNGYESCFSVGDGGPAVDAQLCGPYGLAVDSAGNLFIADNWNGIRRVDAATGIITVVASGAFPFVRGIAIDRADNLYAFYSDRIYRVDPSTSAVTAVVGNGAYGFTGDGGLATLAGIGVLLPSLSAAFDGAGNMFFADAAGDRIRRIDAATGIITTVVGNGMRTYGGDGGAANAAGGSFVSVAVDGNGELYVGGAADRRVRFVSLQPETCGDGVPNPGEHCDAGAANGPPASCCAAACGFAPAGSPCSDNDACTESDQCDASGLCLGGGPPDCDDGDPCSTDGCDPVSGCVHTPTPDSFGAYEFGCIPPDKEALKCSNRVNRSVAKLATAVLRCHAKLAAAAVTQGSFDEEACEAAAQAKYAAANANLIGCLACLDPAAVAAALTSEIETTASGALYCDSTSGMPLGDADDAGFVPVNGVAAACSAKAAHGLWRFIGAEVKCHATLASDAFAGETFGVGKCEGAATIRLTATVDALSGCSACVVAQLTTLEDATAAALQRQDALVYCMP